MDRGYLPEQWRNITIVPIPKPGKDPKNTENYRPISLSSCISKVFEKMVNYRLVWYLERNELLSSFQMGFRRHRSTIDGLIQLENAIQNSFAKRNHLVGIFFDLEKAYDMTWKYGILKQLQEWGLKGNLPKFIESFYSNDHSNLFKDLNPAVGRIMYVDDITIFFSSDNMDLIQRTLQQAINSLVKEADNKGFKFSVSKTNVMHFCRLRHPHNHPRLYMKNQLLECKPQTKFLGIIFDSKLYWKQHIEYLGNRCKKAMNVIRCIANINWGADKEVLQQLYRSMILSKIDYGLVTCTRAGPQLLDPPISGWKELLEIYNEELPIVYSTQFCEIPPWKLNLPTIHKECAKFKKSETNPGTYQQEFLQLINKYPMSLNIYTDGSKTANGTGSAFYTNGQSYSWKIHAAASIYTAELYAIWQAIRYTEFMPQHTSTICTDSLSAIEAISDAYNDNALVQNILALIHHLLEMGKRTILIWTPGHVHIQGNVLADIAARNATEDDGIENIPILVRLTVKHHLEDCVECRDLKHLSGIQGDISKILSNDKRDIDNLLTFLDRAGLTKKM
ncbi:hypothetical protein JTB14_035193 [Gonioctena quinquepunctata]|nr:hypothetical protein JTB14_035193 [Gonioctena quinquepunctata]